MDPETESEGFMQEIAEGTAAGIIKAGQGLGELIALPSDIFLTQTTPTKFKKKAKPCKNILVLTLWVCRVS